MDRDQFVTAIEKGDTTTLPDGDRILADELISDLSRYPATYRAEMIQSMKEVGDANDLLLRVRSIRSAIAMADMEEVLNSEDSDEDTDS